MFKYSHSQFKMLLYVGLFVAMGALKGNAYAANCGPNIANAIPSTCAPHALVGIPGGAGYGYDVSQCGAANTLNDNWSIIQSVIYAACNLANNNVNSGAAPSQVTVYVPAPAQSSAPYVISQALQLQSNVTLSASKNANFNCTGAAAKWPYHGCVLFGSYDTDQIARLFNSRYAVSPINSGDTTITIPSGTASFAPNDIIFIESTSSYLIGGYPRPTWGQLNRIVNIVSDNQISVEYPVAKSVASAQMLKLTNTGLNAQDSTGNYVTPRIPLWATYNARLFGGNWFAQAADQSPLPFSAISGALDCQVNPNSVSGGWGLGYVNLVAHCNMTAPSVSASITPIEFGYSSHNNYIKIDSILVPDTYKGPPARGPFSGLVAIGESSRNNAVNVGAINVAQHTYDQAVAGWGCGSTNACALYDIVMVLSGSSNFVTIGSVQAANINLRNSVVDIEPLAYVGNISSTNSNKITIGNSQVASQNNYVSLIGHSAPNSYPAAYPINNTIVGGNQGGSFQGQLLSPNDATPSAFFLNYASSNVISSLSVTNSQQPNSRCVSTSKNKFVAVTVDGLQIPGCP